jgi:hypothetical protein
MAYVKVTDADALAGALCLGGPVNRRRDGSRAADLSVVEGAPSGLGGGLGLMNIAEERESVKGAVRVAYSFLTPIAWELPGGRWIVSVQHYSLRTMRHQRTIAQAIKYMGKGSPRTLDGRDGVVVLNHTPNTWTLPAAA